MKCKCCGKDIIYGINHNEFSYENDICDECFDKHYSYCDNCDTLVCYEDKNTLSEYGCLCEKCYNQKLNKK